MAESYVTSLILLDEDKILADLNSTAIVLGLINNVFETSRIYIYYAVFARVLGNITQTIAQYINNIDIETTTDEALLEQMIKPFVRKKESRVAKVILEFKRRSDFDQSLASQIFIPRDFEVMTEGDNPIIFRTAESRVLWKDSYRVLVPAYSVEFGSLNNLMANTLTYFDDDSGLLQEIEVTNPYPAYGARDEETAFDTRNRLDMFRYGRDGSKGYLQELIFENGVSYHGYNLVEYWGGAGNVLIALDVASEEEYYDIIQNIEASKGAVGVKYHYCRVNYVYANIDVIVRVINDRMYTEYQANEIEEHVFTATQLYFDNQMYVGRKLSKNRLESFILQYLVDEKYDIYEIELKVTPQDESEFDEEKQQIKINEFERLVPNRIFTDIEYDVDDEYE